MSSTGQIYLTMDMSIALNNLTNYIIGGYKVDFSKWPTEIYDKTNELVHRYHYDDVEGVDVLSKLPNGQTVIDAVNNFEDEYIINANKTNHYHDHYYDGGADFGLSDNSHDGDFKEFLDTYKSKKTKHHIVSGLFSRTFVEKIRKYLGKDNVIVYNIIRNPSVAFLYDNEPVLPEKVLEELKQPDLKLGTNLFSSTISAYTLSQLDYVKTIKYEDLIKQDSIDINGTTVKLSRHIAHNSYIASYEKEMFESVALERKDQLELFNNVFSNVHTYSDITQLPDNLFEVLGYEPLTYEQISS